MNSEKKNLLAEFTAKAEQRLRDKMQQRRQRLYVHSLEQEITIRNLQRAEIQEILDIEDDMEGVRYAVYLGVCDPDLKEVAKTLKETGQIRTYKDVVDLFEYHEVIEISKEIMILSGVNAGKGMKVKAVEDLKN